MSDEIEKARAAARDAQAASGAGYSGTPLPRKLGVREGHRVATLGAPAGFRALLGALPPGVRIEADPGGAGPFDVIVAFCTTEADVQRALERGRERLPPEGGLWICWPKRTSPLATELAERHVRAHGLSTGLVDNKVCAVDQDWSGLRFVVRRADRPARHRR